VRQAGVVRELASRIGDGERGIAGLMMESFLAAGRQDLDLGHPEKLTYGQSITDACLAWDDTAPLLDELASAVRSRR
jgi:3-deoxy-7-phosphoheptulonate synthase